MLAIGNDRISVRYHGIPRTLNLDSRAHINENGVFYNGYKPDAERCVERRHPKEFHPQFSRMGIFTTAAFLLEHSAAQGASRIFLEPGKKQK
jgi:hypothetical protein